MQATRRAATSTAARGPGARGAARREVGGAAGLGSKPRQRELANWPGGGAKRRASGSGKPCEGEARRPSFGKPNEVAAVGAPRISEGAGGGGDGSGRLRELAAGWAVCGPAATACPGAHCWPSLGKPSVVTAVGSGHASEEGKLGPSRRRSARQRVPVRGLAGLRHGSAAAGAAAAIGVVGAGRSAVAAGVADGEGRAGRAAAGADPGNPTTAAAPPPRPTHPPNPPPAAPSGREGEGTAEEAAAGRGGKGGSSGCRRQGLGDRRRRAAGRRGGSRRRRRRPLAAAMAPRRHPDYRLVGVALVCDGPPRCSARRGKGEGCTGCLGVRPAGCVAESQPHTHGTGELEVQRFGRVWVESSPFPGEGCEGEPKPTSHPPPRPTPKAAPDHRLTVRGAIASERAGHTQELNPWTVGYQPTRGTQPVKKPLP